MSSIPSSRTGERAVIFLKDGELEGEPVKEENDDNVEVVKEEDVPGGDIEAAVEAEEEPWVTGEGGQKSDLSSHLEDEGRKQAGRVTSEQKTFKNGLEAGGGIELGQIEAETSSKASLETSKTSIRSERSKTKIRSGFEELKPAVVTKKVKKLDNKKVKKADKSEAEVKKIKKVKNDKIENKNKITRYFNFNEDKNVTRTEVKRVKKVKLEKELPEKVELAGKMVGKEGNKAGAGSSQARAELSSDDCEPNVCRSSEIVARVVLTHSTLKARANSPHCGEPLNHHTQEISRDPVVTGQNGPCIGAKILAPNLTGLTLAETESSGCVEPLDQLVHKLPSP